MYIVPRINIKIKKSKWALSGVPNAESSGKHKKKNSIFEFFLLNQLLSCSKHFFSKGASQFLGVSKFKVWKTSSESLKFSRILFFTNFSREVFKWSKLNCLHENKKDFFRGLVVDFPHDLVISYYIDWSSFEFFQSLLNLLTSFKPLIVSEERSDKLNFCQNPFFYMSFQGKKHKKSKFGKRLF